MKRLLCFVLAAFVLVAPAATATTDSATAHGGESEISSLEITPNWPPYHPCKPHCDELP